MAFNTPSFGGPFRVHTTGQQGGKAGDWWKCSWCYLALEARGFYSYLPSLAHPNVLASPQSRGVGMCQPQPGKENRKPWGSESNLLLMPHLTLRLPAPRGKLYSQKVKFCSLRKIPQDKDWVLISLLPPEYLRTFPSQNLAAAHLITLQAQ